MIVDITGLAKNPLFEERVDEEDGWLRDGHQEVTNRQVHDEIVGRSAELLVTETQQKALKVIVSQKSKTFDIFKCQLIAL